MQLSLSPEQTILYQQRLAEAQDALHQLMIGKKAVSLNYNGEAVTYGQTDEGNIRSYIRELSAALGLVCQARRRGMRV